MTNLKLIEATDRRIDRAKWHKPLVSIVVTHFNYSAHLEDCLLSLLDQTYENWECVVVDDASDDAEHDIAKLLVEKIGDARLRFLALDQNIGQIPAFYAGLDRTKGEFVCALDPDDRYAPDFLGEMVAAHLNPVRAVPLISCEQMLVRNNEVITGVVTGHPSREMDGEVIGTAVSDALRFFPKSDGKWLWSSTSGMMFRRPVLNAMRPHRPLGYKGDLDAWIAQGAHMLGGSMFLSKTLLYRGLHEANDWLRPDFWSRSQVSKLPHRAEGVRADVREAIIANGYERDLVRARAGKRNLAQRLRRSLQKRLDRLAAVLMAKGREA